MSVFIPVWIFYVLGAYPLVGLLSYVPLSVWAHSFIQDGYGPIRFGLLVKGLIGSAVAWPFLIVELAGDERRRQRRKRERAGVSFECEICGSAAGKQSGVWDYCHCGHSYVSKRIEE